MEAYSGLLERTRVPQPSLQRFAVIQIFEKLRSAPPHLNPDSDPGREAITQCLSSSSPAVVDQSVHELCRLVKRSKINISSALLELQSALEECNPRLVDVFVKGIGFLVRFGFHSGHFDGRGLVDAPENHPFVKALCRPEVQNELVEQIVLFVVHSKQYGIQEVCDYLKPVVTFSILRGCSSGSLSSFWRLLISSLVSLYCSLLDEANPLFEMLISCLRCFSCGSIEDFTNAVIFSEFLVDAHMVVLRRLAAAGLVVDSAQLSGVKLLDSLLTACLDFEKHSVGSKPILGLSGRLLSVWKELGLHYVPEMSSPTLSLFAILIQLDLEDEGLYLLNLLRSFLRWKIEDEGSMAGLACNLSEMLLFLFPVINLMSSPSVMVKQAASELLVLLEKPVVNHLTALMGSVSVERKFLSTSKPETIIFRLLVHLWLQDLPSCCFFLNVFPYNGNPHVMENGSKSWLCQLGEYASLIAERRKSFESISASEDVMSAEMPLLLSALVSVLVIHNSVGSYAVEILASLNNVEPRLGVALFLAVVYYINLLRHNTKGCADKMLNLLAVLPSLASHSAMLPLIVQAIMPMLRKDSNLVLYGTALRLLCKAWETNDRIFGSLHGLLVPECFAEFQSDRSIAISMAACLRDICRRNPDRGIELILSVAVCIECHDFVIKALGFHSLGHLCEADVIDFYSAWDVVAKDTKDYSADPRVAYSVCLFLRWGAMDAEAYKEASRSIVQILWDVGCSNCSTVDFLWKKARITAFEAMNYFEVAHIVSSIQDFRIKAVNLLTHETDVDVLRAIRELETRVIAYEYSTRQRLVKETRPIGSKVEKLLDVFPRAIFSPGKYNARDFAGAALFCLPLNPEKSKNASDIFGEYHNMLKEIAASLHLSRNTVLALLSLRSWKTFMQRWLKNYILMLDLKGSLTMLDKTSKAANDILKSMVQVAGDSIPRVAENVGLAMGAFCMVLPASAHPVKVAASKFLLSWLFQYEHEHRQWSAAIALGVISSCLHVTDRDQKLQIVNGLLEVACGSRNSLIKGVSGLGLGYSCQDLLTRVAAAENASDHCSFILQEKALLGKIIRVLSLTIFQLTEISSDLLEALCQYMPPGLDDCYTGMTFESTLKSSDDAVEDLWGIAGLVLGLGTSVTALFRAGSYDAVCSIKLLCTSWVAQAASLVPDCCSGSEGVHIMLSIGACLALPTVSSFCRRVEMMHDAELDDLLSSYEDLISKLLQSRTLSIFLQNLLMASCIGAGGLLAFILDEGVLSLDVQRVKGLLESFKSIYTNTNPHFVHLGGLLGVVSAMGADAGSLIHRYNSRTTQIVGDEKESSSVNVPLLSSPSFEKDLLVFMQDMFLLAQNSDDNQPQAYAAWAMSFLRHHLWSRALDGTNACNKNEGSSRSPHHSVSNDSTVGLLSSWMMQLDYSKVPPNVETVAAVLRCLSCSPRLPNLDWGVVVRRCMRYEGYTADFLHPGSSHEKRTLRVECLQFSIAHANKFDSLLAFLDELTDLFRFRVLDLISQASLLFHLSDLMRIFSSSRIQKLLEDISDYFSSPSSSYRKHNERQKMFLRLSCWKGLYKCFEESSLDTSLYLSHMERCMEALFILLSEVPAVGSSKQGQMPALEWIESIACLSRARRSWLLDLLKISDMDLVQRDVQFGSVLKKIRGTARLVKCGALPMTELARLKSYILNTKSQGMWEVFAEVAAALQTAEGSVKKQWLISVLEMSCMTNYPSTAILFLGLLAGSCCKYMPFLLLDPQAVLVDLPVTLSSLLSSASWGVVAETAVLHIWTSTTRINDWVMSLERGVELPSFCSIDPSEAGLCRSLLPILLDACVRLKEYLPVREQLRLANMVVQ